MPVGASTHAQHSNLRLEAGIIVVAVVIVIIIAAAAAVLPLPSSCGRPPLAPSLSGPRAGQAGRSRAARAQLARDARSDMKSKPAPQCSPALTQGAAPKKLAATEECPKWLASSQRQPATLAACNAAAGAAAGAARCGC